MNKLLSRGLIIAALLSLSVPAALAQVIQTVEPTRSQELLLGPVGEGQSMQLSKLTVLPGGTMELHLLNPQPYTVHFNSPALGISQMVPPNSERVIVFDRSATIALAPNQEVGYFITDDAGNQLAFGNIAGESGIALTKTEIIVVEQKAPPVYRDTTTRSTVRGFW